jgi:hypothetical protein
MRVALKAPTTPLHFNDQAFPAFLRGASPMKSLIPVCVVVLMLAGCNSTAEVEPIPGSITYGGQPRTKLTKSPIGSTVQHEFFTGFGKARETYVLQPDRSLKLVRRDIINDIRW